LKPNSKPNNKLIVTFYTLFPFQWEVNHLHSTSFKRYCSFKALMTS